MSRFRKLKSPTVWRRLAQAAWRAPDDPTIHGQLDIDATEVLRFIEELRNQWNHHVTITDLVVKSLARAISVYPVINGVIRRGTFYQRETVDIFVLVARDADELGRGGGLSGVKVETADRSSLVDIRRRLESRLGEVRAHRDPTFDRLESALSHVPDWLMRPVVKTIDALSFHLDLDLSTFGGLERDPFGSAIVTNVGMMGLSDGFAPLFPLAHCPILIAVGEIRDKPHVFEDQVVARPTLTLGCTADHRFVDGLGAAKMVKSLRETLEDPFNHLSMDLVSMGLVSMDLVSMGLIENGPISKKKRPSRPRRKLSSGEAETPKDNAKRSQTDSPGSRKVTKRPSTRRVSVEKGNCSKT